MVVTDSICIRIAGKINVVIIENKLLPAILEASTASFSRSAFVRFLATLAYQTHLVASIPRHSSKSPVPRRLTSRVGQQQLVMGREGQPPIPASAGGDSHHLLYDQRSVQLPEAAACHHLCDSGFLYRGISYFLLVPAELRPGRFCLVRPAVRHHGECQHLYPERVQQHPTSFPPSFRSSCLRQGVECEGRSYFPHGSFYHSGIYPFHDR